MRDDSALKKVSVDVCAVVWTADVFRFFRSLRILKDPSAADSVPNLFNQGSMAAAFVDP